MTKVLKEMFGVGPRPVREDKVATRAIKDILGKAIQSGVLSPSEKDWAERLDKAVDLSGPDSLTYPKLGFGSQPADRSGRAQGQSAVDDIELPEPTAEPKKAGKKTKQVAEPTKGVEPKAELPKATARPNMPVKRNKAGRDIPATNRFRKDDPGATDTWQKLAHYSPEPKPAARPDLDPTAKKPRGLKALLSRKPKSDVTGSWDRLAHHGGQSPDSPDDEIALGRAGRNK